MINISHIQFRVKSVTTCLTKKSKKILKVFIITMSLLTFTTNIIADDNLNRSVNNINHSNQNPISYQNFPINSNFADFKIKYQDSLKTNNKRSYIPMVAFGITGCFLGMVVGGKIDKPLHPEGEFPELINKSIITGGIIGAIIGSTIGYILGKRNDESKKHKQNISKK
ncbi:MAG: hypothetical protein SCK70_00300 [bacterium]|nr:hypothetical protein [bacterium]